MPNKTILDYVQDSTQPGQSDAFKQQMHTRIDSRVKEETQRRTSGLSFYRSRFLVAVPVTACIALVLGLLFQSVQAPTHTETPATLVKTTPSPLDPELQEIIHLAFAFETQSSEPDTETTPVKTSGLLESEMILAYLRE